MHKVSKQTCSRIFKKIVIFIYKLFSDFTGKLTIENDSIGTNEFILIDDLANVRRGFVQANGSLLINCQVNTVKSNIFV